MEVTQDQMRRMYPELGAPKHRKVEKNPATQICGGAGPNAFPGDSISVWLPLPVANLSPNARCHWSVKAKAVKKARELARLAMIDEMYPHDEPLWKLASVRCVFTFSDNRHRDLDNLLASEKPVFDGMADAGIVVNDSGFVFLPVEIRNPGNDCGVVVTITKIE